MATYKVFAGKKIPDLTGDSLVDQLLLARGIKNKKDAKEFLHPSYEKHIGDPFEIYGIKKAVPRIIDAMKEGEKIAIYSDYDCDGIPGGVLFRDFLETIGYKNYVVYIPHRIKEGYGLNNKAIDELKLNGVSLIVTIDLAITNLDEVLYAKKNKIDVIVTDHHLPINKEGGGQELPKAYAVINSKQTECKYWDNMLCGTAVSWKLSCAILSELRKEKENKKHNDDFKKVLGNVKKLPIGWEKWLLDLVGIATIADMVPLQKENRALAFFGLTVLRKTSRPGLRRIFALNNVNQMELTEDDVSFTVAPRVNAAGRMDSPLLAHKMLFEKNLKEALTYAEILEKLNSDRKIEVKDVIGKILDKNILNKEVILIGNESWSPGVLGLIAQSVVDKTGKPTFVWGKGDDENLLKGSCRSKGDIHVVELMERCKNVLSHSGGHEQSGGFSIDKKNISKLEEALTEALNHVKRKEITETNITIDKFLNLDEVNFDLHTKINTLAPFGVGNPKPLFAFKNVVPKTVRHFGKNKNHLEVIYEKEGKELKAISFNNTDKSFPLLKEPHTLIAHVERNTYLGRNEIRLRIRDIVSQL